MPTDVLIVDDETAFAAGVCEYFTLMGVPSVQVGTAVDALAFCADHAVRLVLLDINLGEGSGFAVCKALRERADVPIWFLSARTSTEDQLLALGLGGDDYIPKPVTLSVLLAKVKAALRRLERRPDVVMEATGDYWKRSTSCARTQASNCCCATPGRRGTCRGASPTSATPSGWPNSAPTGWCAARSCRRSRSAGCAT